MTFCWDRFLKEGDELFNYMTQNFETMFDGDTIIKHFHIGSIYYNYIDKAEEIYNNYGKEIQIELIPWIKNEFEEGRLFQKTNWKPFRNQYELTSMYYGYRKIFQYKNNYLQLALEDGCYMEKCRYCDEENIDSFSREFTLQLYEWDNCEDIQPISRFKVLKDGTLPESFWKIQ
jgi:hypothetical protein